MDMNLHIPVSNFEFIDDNDNHFLKVRLQAIADGENLNRSDFDKQGMEISKDSFRGKPLLCAFPKDKYRNEYKIGDGHNSSDILYDSEYDEFYHSYLDPSSERMVGYIPSDSEITMELIDGKNWICMDAVILRKYNYELVKDILKKKSGKSKRDNKRISVEIEVLKSHMRKHETKDYDVEVIDEFKGMGVTILFDDTQEAVVGANLRAFSESEQYMKFKSFMQCNFEKQFIDKEDIGTGEKIIIKKNELSEKPWGEVNKSELYKKAMRASNYKAVVRFIYAKVETGWMDNPSEKLKYPIAEITDGEARYNKYGLASALGYAKAEGETEIVSKIERIRKQLGIDEGAETYAIEKNIDMLDDEEIVAEYPDKLDMESKEFELTSNQKREIIQIALSEYNEDGCCQRYWVCDMDDTYVYVEDSYNSYRTYRMVYILNQDNTAEVCIDTKEEVIRNGYTVVGQEGENGVKDEFEKEETLAEEEIVEETMEETEAKEETMEESFEEEKPEEETMEETTEETMEETVEETMEETEEDFAEEKTMETIELTAEDATNMAEKCEGIDGQIICKAGEFIVYSTNGKIYASKIDSNEEKFEVNMEMSFNVQTMKTGGVCEGEPTELATIKVAFEDSFVKTVCETTKLEAEKAELAKKIEEMQAKLNAYKCNELSNKFDEICFDVNITVAEKSEWKNRINKNEFASEDELVEKFGGFVFKKNMENKYSAYTSEVITEKVNNKKSYEELIDQYMTDK